MKIQDAIDQLRKPNNSLEKWYADDCECDLDGDFADPNFMRCKFCINLCAFDTILEFALLNQTGFENGKDGLYQGTREDWINRAYRAEARCLAIETHEKGV